MSLGVVEAGAGSARKSAQFSLTDAEFKRVAGILRKETGIHLPESKASLVYSRLARRLRSTGLQNFDEYCGFVSSAKGAEELRQMCAALTTNVTRFFRESHHFEHMKNVSLPPLLKAAKAGERVRIWSSACSSGEEPYSIALTVLSMMPDAASYDIKILATDINPHMVAKGKEGAYPAGDATDIPAADQKRWMTVEDDTITAKDEVKSLITFKELNLVGDWPMRGQFQIIFCRNVVIYFDDATTSGLWTRFSKLIPEGGHLYVGHSERVNGPAASVLQGAGVTIYEKVRA